MEWEPVVIIGALFKITHIELNYWKFNVDNQLVVEALIFALSAFEPLTMS
jgi:hypothetical protein